VPKTKVAVPLDSALVRELDQLIAERRFPNRSQAIEAALAERLARLARTRLAREAAKLDPLEEKALAEEGMAVELAAWPEYREGTFAGGRTRSHSRSRAGRPASCPCPQPRGVQREVRHRHRRRSD